MRILVYKPFHLPQVIQYKRQSISLRIKMRLGSNWIRSQIYLIHLCSADISGFLFNDSHILQLCGARILAIAATTDTSSTIQWAAYLAISAGVGIHAAYSCNTGIICAFTIVVANTRTERSRNTFTVWTSVRSCASYSITLLVLVERCMLAATVFIAAVGGADILVIAV
jgi:hypothetical protein